uniref:Retrovirus-related Pol polyprotein from transposon TNT 1-94 n=1 Tax=Tanacetum cinerariifolium TaxID=118510 RepID=A0A6L2KJF8_TANCI|nr:retrovirus-related Pol polyprotein from transposon TNT 1-94 [Tanacetum cinerariifolium]
MDNPYMTMKEYVRYETEKALRNNQVYNWKTATYGKINYIGDISYLKFFETKFPPIVYGDPLRLDFSSEPTLSSQHRELVGDSCLPPPQAHTERVNAVFTVSENSDDPLKIQNDTPPPCWNMSMFEREKLSGNNFNDWFRQLKLVLRVEKKMHVIEQPLPPAPAVNSEDQVLAQWNALYDAHNEVACLMLGSVTPELHRHLETPHHIKCFRSLNLSLRNKLELKGKITRKPFLHRTEWATDLLGIIHTDLTPPYTPQHNDMSERRNHTLLDMVRSMMNLITLPLSFWDYTLESATCILNMVPTKKVDKTPYELWYRKVPNLSYLKVWGCEALVKRDTPDKLQQRFIKCIFIGYPKETMGYYFYFLPENKIVVARYVEFFEKSLITQEVSRRAIDLEEIQNEDTTPSKITSEIPIEVEGFEPPQEEVIPIHRIKIYIDRSKRLIRLGQHAYIDKILKRYKMDTFKLGHIPMQKRLDLNKTQGASTPEEVKRMQNVPYALAMGSIMYATAMKNILKYLRNTKDMFLVYGGNPKADLRVDCYCDAGFETDTDDIKSQT